MSAPETNLGEDLCEFCGRHPRGLDRRFDHPEGWRLCSHCIKAYIDASTRRREALARMEPA